MEHPSASMWAWQKQQPSCMPLAWNLVALLPSVPGSIPLRWAFLAFTSPALSVCLSTIAFSSRPSSLAEAPKEAPKFVATTCSVCGAAESGSVTGHSWFLKDALFCQQCTAEPFHETFRRVHMRLYALACMLEAFQKDQDGGLQKCIWSGSPYVQLSKHMYAL